MHRNLVALSPQQRDSVPRGLGHWLTHLHAAFCPDGRPAQSTVFGTPTKPACAMSMGWFCYHRSRVDRKGCFQMLTIYFFPPSVWSQPNVHEFVLLHTYHHCCEKEPWSGPRSPGGIPKHQLLKLVASCCLMLLLPPTPKDKSPHWA